jgi:hypothetical protein
MASFRGQFLALCVLLAILFSRGMAQEKGAKAVDGYGTLIIHVTWGDLNNTPAVDVYVVAHGYNSEHHAPPSYVFSQVNPGQYESSLPPGVYDVFVSEGNSVPRCKRVLIQPKRRSYWTLKLEDDEVYTSR